MKIKGLFVAVLAAMVLFSCNNENEDLGRDKPAPKGQAYLALSFVNGSTQTKANTTDNGTEAESKAGKISVLLFDDNGLCLGVKDFSGVTVGNSGGSGSPAATASTPILVPAATTKVFVVINNYDAGWNIGEAAIKGRLWKDINTSLSEQLNANNVATDNQFMMVNKGEIGSALAPVTVKEKQEEATAAAKTITVNRLAAKVVVTTASTITVTPTGANFEFKGWDLNTTNKMVKLYTEMVAYNNASTTAAPGVYRIDDNYTDLLNKDNTYLTATYNWLTNGSDINTISKVEKAKDATAYCLENTMDAASQLWGHTTKVVVKGKYLPIGIAESYFSWAGSYFTKGQMKAAYKIQPNLKTDLIKFLKEADNNITDGSDDTAIDVAIDALDAYSGVKVSHDLAMRYYHDGISYYDVLIRHDQNVTEKMALGRYGVIRNNWYSLSVNSVSGPGTPWIPDPKDPKDPTNPTDPDDEADAYLSVSITVEPWTMWQQGVDLH